MTQDELRKEFEAAYPMPEGIVRNQWGKYSPFDKETFLMTESLIYNVRYEVYQAAALKRDAELEEARKAHADLFATSQQMNADLVALRAEIAAAKAQPQSPLHDMDAKIKAWYSRHYDSMRKHMPEYSELELEAYMGAARAHYIEGFSDARLAHLMDEQSGTTESPPSEA